MKRVDEARVIKIAEAAGATVVPGSGAIAPSVTSVTGLQGPSAGAQVRDFCFQFICGLSSSIVQKSKFNARFFYHFDFVQLCTVVFILYFYSSIIASMKVED